MHNYIAYISGGKSHTLLDAHNTLQSIADKVDLFVHSGEGFCVLLALYATTFFMMFMLLKRSVDDATFFKDFNEKLLDKMQDSHAEYDAIKMFVDNLKENGYVRNKHGVMQRIDDWMKNGSRKPKRREKKRAKASAASKAIMDHFTKEDAEGVISVGEIEIDVTPKRAEPIITVTAIPTEFVPNEYEVSPKPMTRAEACLAILNEAKDAGFPWAQSAIDQFDPVYASNNDRVDKTRPLMSAVYEFRHWGDSKEGVGFWNKIAYSDKVQSFKPKTQWPA